MSKKGQYQIPFDAATGDMLSYGGYHYHGVEWRDNYVFTAELALIDVHRGRSAATFEWLDTKIGGVHYFMFLTDMVDLLKRSRVENGVTFDSQWTFVKRGANFGIHLYNIPPQV